MTMHRSYMLRQYLYLSAAYSSFFVRRRCLDYPFRIHLQTHTRCNARCSMCPYAALSARNEHGTMRWEVFDRLVTELSSADTPATVLFELHHEPLMNPDIFSWVRHLKRSAPRTRCIVITNGSLLDGFSLDEIAASGLDTLSVSLNAYTAATYEQLNTGLDFAQVMDNTRRLAGHAAVRRLLRVSFVLTEVNRLEIRDALAFWSDQGIATQVKPLTNRAGTLRSYDSLQTQIRDLPGGEAKFGSEIRRRIRSFTGCPLPFYQTGILFNGDVILCCQDWNHDPVIGNIESESLRSIWNGPTLTAIRRSILAHRYDEILPCRDCSLAR